MRNLFFITGLLCFALMLTSCEKNGNPYSENSNKNIVGKWAVEEMGSAGSIFWWCIDFKSDGTLDAYNNQKNAHIENGYLIGESDWYISYTCDYYKYYPETSMLSIEAQFYSEIDWVNADEMYVLGEGWHCYRIKGLK